MGINFCVDGIPGQIKTYLRNYSNGTIVSVMQISFSPFDFFCE
jgi:hypothetical protein